MQVFKAGYDDKSQIFRKALPGRMNSILVFKDRFKLRSTFLQKLAIHTVAFALLGWLVWDYFTGGLTINPYQAATQRTGKYALVFLTASLACTPARILLGWNQALRLSRLLGLYALGFASFHMFIFVGLDYGFDWGFLWQDLANKRYIWVGLITLVILTSLAVTSFKWWMKKLGKNWKRLHRLVYLAGMLVILHYLWSKKGDLLEFQGEVIQPFAFGVTVALLLLVRIPAVRKKVTGWRTRITMKLQWNIGLVGKETP